MSTDFRSKEKPQPVAFRILTARRINNRDNSSKTIVLLNEAHDAWDMNYYEVEDIRDGDKCVIMINRAYYSGNIKEDEVQINIRNIGKKMEAEPYPKRARVEGIDDFNLRLGQYTDKAIIESVNGQIENEEKLLS